MQVTKTAAGWQPRSDLKRYWDRTLWSSVFDTLLNVPPEGLQPNLRALGASMLVSKRNIWHPFSAP